MGPIRSRRCFFWLPYFTRIVRSSSTWKLASHATIASVIRVVVVYWCCLATSFAARMRGLRDARGFASFKNGCWKIISEVNESATIEFIYIAKWVWGDIGDAPSVWAVNLPPEAVWLCISFRRPFPDSFSRNHGTRCSGFLDFESSAFRLSRSNREPVNQIQWALMSISRDFVSTK